MSDQYALGFGRIVVNLIGLETALRGYLSTLDRAAKESGRPAWDCMQWKLGDKVDEDAFTSYDSLGRLIEEYNTRVEGTDAALCVDTCVVDLRHAIAHGCILGSVGGGPWRLFKFGEPRNGKAELTRCEDLTVSWLDAQAKRVRAEVQKVVEAQGRWRAKREASQ
jgi:hypothetical protein